MLTWIVSAVLPTPPSPKTTNLYNVILPAMAISAGRPEGDRGEDREETREGEKRKKKKKEEKKKQRTIGEFLSFFNVFVFYLEFSRHQVGWISEWRGGRVAGEESEGEKRRGEESEREGVGVVVPSHQVEERQTRERAALTYESTATQKARIGELDWSVGYI